MRKTSSLCLAVLILASVLFSADAWATDTTTMKRGVTIDGKLPVDYVTQEYGNAYAVVIGIDAYTKAPRLNYAAADASAIGSALQSQGFQVTVLLNEKATRQMLYKVLFDSLGGQVSERDRVIVFFAGHGETRQLTGGKKMGYLLPVDGDPAALAETSLSMSAIRDLADSLPAKHVLFLVDTCYGGIAGHQFRSVPKITEQYLRELTKERGRQIITAGDENQQALEGPQWGHSVFTYYLLQGIGGRLADLNGDGIIPASELYHYLDERVFAAATMNGHKQRPQWWSLAAEHGEFVFLPSAGTQLQGKLEPPSNNLQEARVLPYQTPPTQGRILDAVYKFKTVGNQGGFQAPAPRASPYFQPYVWVPYFELIEKELRFYKDGRFEEATYVRKQYSEPGSGFGDPPKQTPWELKEKATGSYELKEGAGILLYSTGRKSRFQLSVLDDAFWPPETLMIKDDKWSLVE